MLNITQLIIVTIAKKLNVKNDELMEKEFVDNRKDVKYWKKYKNLLIEQRSKIGFSRTSMRGEYFWNIKKCCSECYPR